MVDLRDELHLHGLEGVVVGDHDVLRGRGDEHLEGVVARNTHNLKTASLVGSAVWTVKPPNQMEGIVIYEVDGNLRGLVILAV